MEVLKDELARAKGNTIVVGDLNLNMKDQRPQPAKLHAALKAVQENRQHVGFVTRQPVSAREKQGSIIDHEWSTEQCRCTHNMKLAGLSDHTAVRFTFKRDAGKAIHAKYQTLANCTAGLRIHVLETLSCLDFKVHGGHAIHVLKRSLCQTLANCTTVRPTARERRRFQCSGPTCTWCRRNVSEN